jgi:hypothetical protein
MVFMTWVSDTAGIALDGTPVRVDFFPARVWSVPYKQQTPRPSRILIRNDAKVTDPPADGSN